MSEDRIPDVSYKRRLARIEGKILHENVPLTLFEMYGAYQFTSAHNRSARNFHPLPPIRREDRKEWNKSMFRLRIDGKWHKSKEKPYLFFTMAEAFSLFMQPGDIGREW